MTMTIHVLGLMPHVVYIDDNGKRTIVMDPNPNPFPKMLRLFKRRRR